MGGGLRRTSLRAGFTIVELLIVIIVIAILATLMAAAYSGIRERAGNSVTVSAVASQIKAIKLYIAENDTFPTYLLGEGSIYPCIGEKYDYSNGQICGQAGGSCVSGGVGCTTSIQSGYKDQIRKYYNGGKIPTPSSQLVNYEGTNYLGAYVHANSPTQLFIRYFLSGNVSCGAPGGINGARSYGDANSSVCTVNLSLS